jgi:hypothetical protein
MHKTLKYVIIIDREIEKTGAFTCFFTFLLHFEFYDFYGKIINIRGYRKNVMRLFY